VHHEAGRDDQRHRLERRQHVQPDRAGHQRIAEAGGAGDERGGEGAGEDQAELDGDLPP
jgi:hypothetical protein